MDFYCFAVSRLFDCWNTINVRISAWNKNTCVRRNMRYLMCVRFVSAYNWKPVLKLERMLWWHFRYFYFMKNACGNYFVIFNNWDELCLGSQMQLQSELFVLFFFFYLSQRLLCLWWCASPAMNNVKCIWTITTLRTAHSHIPICLSLKLINTLSFFRSSFNIPFSVDK